MEPAPLIPLDLGGAQRCPWCHDAITARDPLALCSGCRTIYHRSCLAEADGACGTLGCGGAPARPPAGKTARRRPALQAAALATAALAAVGLARWLAQPDPPPAPEPMFPVLVTRPDPYTSQFWGDSQAQTVWVVPLEVDPLPRTTDQETLIVRGHLHQPGPARAILVGPNGQRSEWDLSGPAALTGSVSLPTGVSEIRVIVVDATGRRHEVRRTVRRIDAR